MKNHFIYEGSVEIFYAPQEMKHLPLFWAKGYHKENVHEKYNPHITLGLGIPKEIKNPIERLKNENF